MFNKKLLIEMIPLIIFKKIFKNCNNYILKKKVNLKIDKIL